MAAKFLVKRTSSTGNAPNTSQLQTGELALNLPDGRMYGSNGTIIFEIGANTSATSVGANNLFINATTARVNSALTIGAFTIPRTDGTANQVLTTDGSGAVTWEDGSSGAGAAGGGPGITITTFKYEPASNQTVFQGVDENGNILDYVSGQEDLYLNGIKLLADDDYAATNTTCITLAANAVSGDTLEIQRIVGNTNYKEFEYTVASNTTSFSGADDNGTVLNYIAGGELVFLNGVKLVTTDDYAAANSTHCVLTANAVSGDILQVLAFGGATKDLLEATGYASADTSLLTIDTFNKATFRTAKYFIQANTSDSFTSSEALVVHDGTNAFTSEYGMISSNGVLYAVSADISGVNCRLRVTPTRSGTTFKMKRIGIKV